MDIIFDKIDETIDKAVGLASKAKMKIAGCKRLRNIFLAVLAVAVLACFLWASGVFYGDPVYYTLKGTAVMRKSDDWSWNADVILTYEKNGKNVFYKLKADPFYVAKANCVVEFKGKVSPAECSHYIDLRYMREKKQSGGLFAFLAPLFSSDDNHE